MDRIRNILVAVDFSPCSAVALRQAVRIAGHTGASVSALHVVPIPMYAEMDAGFMPIGLPPVDLLTSEAKNRWSLWRPAIELGRGVAFEAVLGMPRGDIIAAVERGSFDLLVIGAHGELDAKRGVGSVAAGCVQHAHAKVLVVRESASDPFKSVCACVDFSETSRVALDQAIRVAALDNAALHVLHIYEDPWRHSGPPKGVQAHMPDLAAQFHDAVERHLVKFCEPLAHEIGALKGTYHALRFEGHGKGIIDFVTRERCDLVALGTRGKWNVHDFLWGSTAERVVRDAPCSALAVKPPGFGQK